MCQRGEEDSGWARGSDFAPVVQKRGVTVRDGWIAGDRDGRQELLVLGPVRLRHDGHAVHAPNPPVSKPQRDDEAYARARPL